MLCRKCKNTIDLNDPGLICKNCKYDNILNPENLPEVDIQTTMAFDTSRQYTCPKCGGHNVALSNPNLKIENTPYSAVNGMMGLCCCGIPGLLMGLTGGRKASIEQEKICNDCGTHFK